MKSLVKTQLHKSAGLIIKNKKLLVERSAHKDYFKAPGGEIEAGADLRTSLITNLKNNLKITVAEEDLQEFGVFNSVALGHTGRTVKIEVFVIKKYKGLPKASKDIEEIKWITSDAISKLKVSSILSHDVMPKLKKKNLIL